MNKLIEQVFAEIDAPSNPYFVALGDKTFAKVDFVETQIQFLSAVEFFSRPMAAMAARIPTASGRVEVLRNVWEEHGEGDLRMSHGSMFREFLLRLDGVTEQDIARRAPWPEVRAFNTTLVGSCVLDDYLVSASMMGMIELMFSSIAAWIGRAVVANGWLPAEQMVHYTLHERLDVRHSDDFFDVVRPEWSKGPHQQYRIEQGLRMGATIFHGLYEGLWRARERRVFVVEGAIPATG